MAESDTVRFALRRWSAGTDTPSRTEFDTAHANIEASAAGFLKGTLAARPAAAAANDRFLYLVDSGASVGLLFYSDAANWKEILGVGRIAAKGDLIAGAGAATFGVLTAGSNGKVLVADSAEATGLKYVAPMSDIGYVRAGSSNTIIQTIPAGGANNNLLTATITIPATWASYDLYMYAGGQFNVVSGGNILIDFELDGTNLQRPIRASAGSEQTCTHLWVREGETITGARVVDWEVSLNTGGANEADELVLRLWAYRLT